MPTPTTRTLPAWRWPALLLVAVLLAGCNRDQSPTTSAAPAAAPQPSKISLTGTVEAPAGQLALLHRPTLTERAGDWLLPAAYACTGLVPVRNTLVRAYYVQPQGIVLTQPVATTRTRGDGSYVMVMPGDVYQPVPVVLVAGDDNEYLLRRVATNFADQLISPVTEAAYRMLGLDAPQRLYGVRYIEPRDLDVVYAAVHDDYDDYYYAPGGLQHALVTVVRNTGPNSNASRAIRKALAKAHKHDLWDWQPVYVVERDRSRFVLWPPDDDRDDPPSWWNWRPRAKDRPARWDRREPDFDPPTWWTWDRRDKRSERLRPEREGIWQVAAARPLERLEAAPTAWVREHEDARRGWHMPSKLKWSRQVARAAESAERERRERRLARTGGPHERRGQALLSTAGQRPSHLSFDRQVERHEAKRLGKPAADKQPVTNLGQRETERRVDRHRADQRQLRRATKSPERAARSQTKAKPQARRQPARQTAKDAEHRRPRPAERRQTTRPAERKQPRQADRGTNRGGQREQARQSERGQSKQRTKRTEQRPEQRSGGARGQGQGGQDKRR